MRAFVLLLAALPLGAVIVDRVAVSVGNRVITESEISLRIRLTAFQNGEKPDFTLHARREACKRLIDQKLVEREMEVGHYPSPSAEESLELLNNFTASNYKGSKEALSRALADYSLTAEDLENDLARQSELLTFLSLRFRPTVQINDGDVQQYFRTNILSKASPGETITLEDFRARIEQAITNERADHELDLWLKDQRKRTRIEYLNQELAP